MAKCSLCGGTLDENKRCTFCGLDNTKNDEQYEAIMNRSACDGKPLTHVHEHAYNRPKNAGKPGRKNAKANMVVAVIGVIAVIVGFLAGFLSDVGKNSYVESETEVTYDAYLESGLYEIGTDIPEGSYTIELDEGDWGTVEVQEMIGDTVSTQASYILDDENTRMIEGIYLEEDDMLSISPEMMVHIYSADAE